MMPFFSDTTRHLGRVTSDAINQLNGVINEATRQQNKVISNAISKLDGWSLIKCNPRGIFSGVSRRVSYVYYNV